MKNIGIRKSGDKYIVLSIDDNDGKMLILSESLGTKLELDANKKLYLQISKQQIKDCLDVVLKL